MFRKKSYDLRIRIIVFDLLIQYWNRSIKRLLPFISIVVLALFTLTISYADELETLPLEVTKIIVTSDENVFPDPAVRDNLTNEHAFSPKAKSDCLSGILTALRWLSSA